MITTYGCICIIIRREAIKNKDLVDEWIKKGVIRESGYDEHLICILAGMNPWDAEDTGLSVSKRLGIEIYDTTNPYEPISKDGVYEESLGGLCAPCNWLKREEGRHNYSYVPENERRPYRKIREYDPSKDVLIKDFGEYKGQPLLLMENYYELYLKTGTVRNGIFLPIGDPETVREVIRGISREEAIMYLKDDDKFDEVIKVRVEAENEKAIQKEIFLDLGDSEIGHIYIVHGRYGNFIRLASEKEKRNMLLPKEYRESKELCESLTNEQVVAFINQENAEKKAREVERKKREFKRTLNIIVDFGESSEGLLRIVKGRFGNYIMVNCNENQKNYRLPKEYQHDDNLCRALSLETVLSFIKNSKR